MGHLKRPCSGATHPFISGWHRRVSTGRGSVAAERRCRRPSREQRAVGIDREGQRHGARQPRWSGRPSPCRWPSTSWSWVGRGGVGRDGPRCGPGAARARSVSSNRPCRRGSACCALEQDDGGSRFRSQVGIDGDPGQRTGRALEQSLQVQSGDVEAGSALPEGDCLGDPVLRVGVRQRTRGCSGPHAGSHFVRWMNNAFRCRAAFAPPFPGAMRHSRATWPSHRIEPWRDFKGMTRDIPLNRRLQAR